ncbi:MAG: glycosyltransferase family 39 protein [Ignavibacteriales bacterium]|nr:glycosyltransferase family 39 protein [Ignavibacteriales bacterium]
MSKFPYISKNEIALIIIIIVAGFLRFLHIGWGLPELFEEGTSLTIAWKFWNWGNPGFNFNPEFFNYPALTFYIQFVAQMIHFGIGNVFGFYTTINDFGATITPLVCTARAVDAIFEIGIILVIYRFANEFFNRRTAIITALILAVNPLHIKFSHLIQVDTILTFFSTLAVLYIFRIYSNPKSKWYYLAGISIGLATSSKYTGAFLIIFLIATHIMRSDNLRAGIRTLKDQRLIIGLMIALGLFMILNPFILLTPNAFEKDFSFEQQHMAGGHLGVPESKSTLYYYFLDAIPGNFGWIFYIVSLLSIIIILKEQKRKELLLLIYPLLFLVVVSTWVMRAERYILPIFPMIAVIGAMGIDKFLSAIEVSKSKVWKHFKINPTSQTVLLSVICLTVMIHPLFYSFNYLKSLGLPDTRTITKTWMRNNVPCNSVIATGPFGVDIRDGSYTIFDIPFLAFESERVAAFYDARWYEDMDILVTSSYDKERYAQEPMKYKAILPFYDSLQSRWKLVYEIHANENQTGPSFWIYKYPDSSNRAKFSSDLFQRFNASPESSRISNFLKGLDNILVKKNKIEKAVQVTEEILSVEYQNLPLRNLLGELLLSEEKYEEALKHLGLSLQQDPKQLYVYILGSKALRGLKKFPPAEAALYKAIEYKQDFGPAYLELIELFSEQKNDGKLIDVLKRYYAILPPQSRKAIEVHERIQKLQKVIK